MNKKLWIGFIAVFIGISALDYVVHGVILLSAYKSDAMMRLMRPETEMSNLMWVYYVVNLIVAFFFTLVFSKGYEGKGIAEGVRYGFYMGMIMATPMAYSSYAMYPMPYSVCLQWFLYGVVTYVVLGILVALVYGSKPKESAVAA